MALTTGTSIKIDGPDGKVMALLSGYATGSNYDIVSPDQKRVIASINSDISSSKFIGMLGKIAKDAHNLEINDKSMTIVAIEVAMEIESPWKNSL